jgi:hypothetical protein
MSNVLAALLGIVAYSMVNIGFFLQKRAAAALPAIESTDASTNMKNFLTNKMWLIGFSLTIIQMIPFWIALSLGSISVVTPMIGVGLIVFVVLSATVGKEPISKSEYFGIAGIVIGLVLIGITTQSDTRVWSLQDMVVVFLSPGSLLFLIILLVVSIGFTVVCIGLKYRGADILLGISSGIFASFGAIFSKAFMTGFDDRVGGGFLFALGSMAWWIFFIGLIVANGASLVEQQMGFQKGKGVILISIFNVVTVMVPSLSGVIMFNEWSGIDPSMLTLKLISYGILSVGIVLLSVFTQKAGSAK